MELREQILAAVLDARRNNTSGVATADAILELLKGAVPVWQPIETAPKDGTHVILGTTGAATAGRTLLDMFFESGEWGNYDDVIDDMLFTGERLTHWMPMLAPPASSQR